MRDWREMTARDFDRDAPDVQLALDGMPVSEPAGTGDLFTLLDQDA